MYKSNFLASSALDHMREVSPHEMANAIRVLAMDAVGCLLGLQQIVWDASNAPRVALTGCI
jgi:hypothetical protein